MNLQNNLLDYLNTGKKILFEIFKNFSTKDIKKNSDPINQEIVAYLKFSSATINFILYLLVMLILLNFLYNFFFKKISYLMTLLKFTNIFFIVFIIVLLIIKFYFSLKLEQCLGPYLYDIKLNFYLQYTQQSDYEHFIVFSSSLSDAILILSFITGLICLELLGLKNLFKNISNINIFFMFNIFVTIMVSTNNLLIMFISFEFIFLPTMYFVYVLGYSKKIDKANEVLFYWTLCGSFMILCTLAYLFYNFNTLNYIILQQQNLSKIESQIIFLIILIGFGVKIPLAPFHHWLLKVHVESPTAFSIFLSGFLVKSALYCLFMFITLLSCIENYYILTCWIFYSLVISTLGLSRQSDIKKLIAWATVQEMTFMLLFLVFKQVYLNHTFVLFIVLHGLMSSYMFYIVDIIQRRYKTRSLLFIQGLHLILPKLSKHIWFLILLFSGFPLTAKFFIEWSLISLMIETQFLTLVYVILFVNFAGAIFFCRIMFTIIYGVREKLKEEIDLKEDIKFEFTETQKKEYIILNFLMIFILILVWLIYIIKWLKKKSLLI